MIERLGKYRIVGTIGQGGMGTVYRALDPVLDRQVALKVVSADGELSAEQKARLLREGKACAQLSHPNVISIYDLGEDAGHIFIVMELLQGQDLKQLIAAHATMSVVEKLALMIQVCDGLHYAHQQGIVHRDIKPANIFVLPDGRLKILDFGLAHLTTGDPTLTQSGQILGTLAYMAPERFRGLGDYRGDIFAVGAVCYELLTGHRAFVAETAVQLIEMIRTAHPPPLASMDASLPPELAVAVERALRKEPSARFADLGGMRAALDQVRQRLLNPGDARTLVPTMSSPADATPQAMGDVPDTVSADHPPASSSRPRTATLAGRFATHLRRFRLAISVSFTVSLAVAVYFVNLPRYADIDASRVPIPPPMTDSQPAPQSLPSEQPIQSPISEAPAKKQITRDDRAGKREEPASPPPAGRLLRRPTQEGAAEQQLEAQRQEVPPAAVMRPAPAPPGLEAQRSEAQKQEAQEQAAQWLAARKQAEQRQEAQRLAAVERERQSQAELIAISEAKKQADGAKARMLTEKQRASTAAPGYAEAQNEERQANALYERSSFNEAAEKYQSAAMLYARAKPAASPPRPVRPALPPGP